MTASNPRYQQQRLEAIRAAAAVFAEKGFHGASTAAIAERMGIKQGSLYYYFKSKEDALGEVCLYGLESYASRMTAIADSDQPFAARLLATVTSHLTSYREKNEALKVYNDERLYLPEEKRSPLKTIGSRYRQQLEDIIRGAQEAGEVTAKVDAHFAAQAIIGLCNAFGEHIVRDHDVDLFDLISQCTQILLGGLAANPQPNP
ncbi:MAG: TetR/AcrR family transcriptional regulator [Gammaproteobacteria bacterium]